MKAEIDKVGTLKIIAETDLEVFALSVWHEKYVKPSMIPGSCEIDGSKVIFDGSINEVDH